MNLLHLQTEVWHNPPPLNPPPEYPPYYCYSLPLYTHEPVFDPYPMYDPYYTYPPTPQSHVYPPETLDTTLIAILKLGENIEKCSSKFKDLKDKFQDAAKLLRAIPNPAPHVSASTTANAPPPNDVLDESITKVVPDVLPLSFEPTTSIPEAKEEPIETVLHVHCSNDGQVCSLLSFNDSLTDIASLALDEKIKLSTISHVYIPMRAIILRWYRDLKIMQDLRTNPFEEEEINAYEPDPEQPSKRPRPMPKPPWSLESPPSIFNVEAHVPFGPIGFAAHRLHSFPLSRPCLVNLCNWILFT